MKPLKTKNSFDKKIEIGGEIVDEKQARKRFAKNQKVIMIIHKGSLEEVYLIEYETDFSAFKYVVTTYIVEPATKKENSKFLNTIKRMLK